MFFGFLCRAYCSTDNDSRTSNHIEQFEEFVLPFPCNKLCVHRYNQTMTSWGVCCHVYSNFSCVGFSKREQGKHHPWPAHREGKPMPKTENPHKYLGRAIEDKMNSTYRYALFVLLEATTHLTFYDFKQEEEFRFRTRFKEVEVEATKAEMGVRSMEHLTAKVERTAAISDQMKKMNDRWALSAVKNQNKQEEQHK